MDKKLDQILEKLSVIEIDILKLQEDVVIIKSKVDGDLKNSCQKMSEHIDFIENVYDNVKNPLGFICNKISSISGNSNYTLENLDVSSHQDYESSDN